MIFDNTICRAVSKHRQDKWTHTQHNHHANAAWTQQIPALVEAYLCWRHGPENHRHGADEPSHHTFSVSRVLCALHNQSDEPKLVPRRLHSMDGNHSAKRIDGSGSMDPSARSVEENKVLVFEQTGIFIMACRHGFVECITEMKRSGELAKYGLAAINHMLDVCGKDQGLGSNSACGIIRHASYFHWVQYLDLHFDQWDKDKYLELSNFLRNNYAQALHMIEEYTPLLDEFKMHKSLTDDAFFQWREEESEFLANLALEPPSDAIAVAYVEELEKLQRAEATYGNMTGVPFLMYMPASFTSSSGLNSQAHQSSKSAEAELLAALRRLRLQMNVVEDFECQHGIDQCWEVSDPRYHQAHEYSGQRHFVRVVEELEGLVVQCMFELSKANLSGTGYKMRKYISKAIT
ncbi:uncharacterized protein EDB91DRAFT_1240015 [Suillus paluster]|uniref:uncharacterized protein n=1 Tax=Suillus paluster TaxID=48578 RepID=UPI001B87F5F4|nr:uncharacterized protein EDB91DRAFT_1240015 [Suillus paluster]KAG1723983.1 hypothetical protein EDB91DRAFT_1240015 [Suillus paluster]